MYIWIACDLSDSLEKVRGECLRINENIGADEVAFNLPQHVSLKISFRIDDALVEDVITDIRGYLKELEPFSVSGPTLEMSGNIVWLRFCDAPELVKIHSELDEMLLTKYGVPQHEFDKSFAFHSTLFIDENRERLSAVYNGITSVFLPKNVFISRYIIGISESGKAGEYRVLEFISAKK